MLIGKDAVARMGLSDFDIHFGLEPLVDKTLAIIGDARLEGGERHAMLMERILNISGQDSISVPQKYRSNWQGPLNVRFLILTNEMPMVSDPSGAFASRFLILDMKKSFFGAEDVGLFDRLRGELPGVLAWSLHGWARLHQRGYFLEPKSAQDRREEMEYNAAPIQAFVSEACELGNEDEIYTECSMLYQTYVEWMKRREQRPLPIQWFSNQLGSAYRIRSVRGTATSSGRRPRLYLGVRAALLSPNQDSSAQELTRGW